jgi:siroheme synthase-like protein
MATLAIDLNDRLCVVVGGGSVGRRKAGWLLSHGARVTLVEPEPLDPDETLVGHQRLSVQACCYRPGLLDGAILVVAATDDRKINATISADARERGILVTRVDSGVESQVIFPALLEAGNSVVAVHSHGLDCLSSKGLRDHIASGLGLRAPGPLYFEPGAVEPHDDGGTGNDA